MTKVKGSPVYRLKVVPHRPLRSALIAIALLLLALGAVLGSYYYATAKASAERLSPEEGEALHSQVETLIQETAELRRELAKYQVGAEVDRQAGEELRKRVMELREEKAALQRDVEVYRIMTSKKNSNPKGISFGVFSVTTTPEGKRQFKLVVQKLADDDEDFVGHLTVQVIGQQEGQEARYSLHQLAANSTEPLAEKIPLQFKFFQSVETEIQLPDGFVPARVALAVKPNTRRNPVTVEAQLEWPEHK